MLVAIIVSGIMRLLKQPLIIGYIITGIIASPYILGLVKSFHEFESFAQIGVALLLFLVGLHLNPRSVKDVGKVSLITGLGQVLFTSLFGFLIALLLGFSITVSVYIAIALTFSSTIIIMKLLSDRGDMETLYGRISIGFLIVQDLVAVFILMFISSMSAGGDLSSIIISSLVNGVILLIVLFAFGRFLLPRVVGKIAKSQEFLLFFSAGWCLMVSSAFYLLGFSIEVGALLAGMTLSMSPYRFEITSRLKPLRDFFILMFFVLLGSQMVFTNISEYILPVILFSLFVLIGNPLIVLTLMGLLGYTKRTAFKAGLTVAQISEFSLILVALGLQVGHLSPEVISIVTLIGIITIAGSSYFIIYSDQIYSRISKYLSVFERKNLKEKSYSVGSEEKYEAILFGCNRIGEEIVSALQKTGKKFLVVDFNPDTIKKLHREGIKALYGDADDIELLNELNFENVKMVLSTIPDLESQMLLIRRAANYNKNIIIIVVAHKLDDALLLYDAGATYVIMPYYLGGSHSSMMLEEYGFDMDKFISEKIKHLSELKKKKHHINHPDQK